MCFLLGGQKVAFSGLNECVGETSPFVCCMNPPSFVGQNSALYGHTMRTTLFALATMAGLATLANAQTASSTGPAPRPLPAPTIVSPKFADSAFNVVALPNGMLLINDTRNHRVMLSDSLLRVTTVIIDSTEYGSRSAALMAYPGDSVMFVEAVTPSMTLIDPTGKVVRSMAVPNPRNVGWLMPSPINMAAIDSRGRFVHRGVAPRVELPRIKPGETRPRTFPDSSPIIRDSPTTHAGDTIIWVRSISIETVEVARADGRSMSYSKSRAEEAIDEWAVLSNVLLAVVRGRDYRIDLVDPDGKVTALPRIPYAWERLTDDQKVVLSDSVNKAREEALKSPPRMMSGGGSAAAGGGGGGGLGNAALNRADYPPPPPGSLDLKPADLPDYRAAFTIGAIRADAEGNLWIRTEQRVGDTTKVVRDVVNSAGKLIDRIIMPKDRSIVGFDRHGNVFLVGKADGGIQWIERVKWRK